MKLYKLRLLDFQQYVVLDRVCGPKTSSVHIYCRHLEPNLIDIKHLSNRVDIFLNEIVVCN